MEGFDRFCSSNIKLIFVFLLLRYIDVEFRFIHCKKVEILSFRNLNTTISSRGKKFLMTC